MALLMTPSPTLHVIAQLAELFDLLGVAVLLGGTFVTCGRAIDVGQVAGQAASRLTQARATLSVQSADQSLSRASFCRLLYLCGDAGLLRRSLVRGHLAPLIQPHRDNARPNAERQADGVPEMQPAVA